MSDSPSPELKILKELKEAKNLTSFTINPALETLAPALENKGGESRPSAPPRRARAPRCCTPLTPH